MNVPRPDGMSERRLAQLEQRHQDSRHATATDFSMIARGSWRPSSQRQCELLMQAADTELEAIDLLAECRRLRVDGDTLLHRAEQAETTAGDAKREIDRLVVRCGEFSEAHAASFKALHTLSAALFDGEADDYAALAEKVIARVRQLEADGATLREELVSGRAQWQQERDEYRQIVESSETALATLRERVKKLPSPNDVLTDGQLAWWLSHATDPWQIAIGRELTEARRTLALLAEDTRRLLLKTVDDFKASAPKEPTL